MKILFALLAVGTFELFAMSAVAQKRTPLEGVGVTLERVAATGKSDEAPDQFANPSMSATTDAEGKFVFGYMRPGIYALGCSYEDCCTAFEKNASRDSLAHSLPSVQISINSCEGMYCRVSTGKMTPDDMMTCSLTSTQTAVSRGWNNSKEWLKSGGGVVLKIDGARAIVSGKIEAQ